MAFSESEEVDGFVWYYRDLGESVEIVSPYAAGGSTEQMCSTWEDVTVPAKLGGKPVTSIGTDAFRGAAFTGITIPNTVTNIGDAAFGSLNITSFTIPDGVISIGNSAFQCCWYLKDIEIPDSVRSFGWAAFSCTGLETFSIPLSMTVIPYEFLAGCHDLYDIEFHDGIVAIQGGAFSECSLLAEFDLPRGLESIDQNAFDGCGPVNEFVVSEKMQYLDLAAFRHVQLRRLIIPDTDIYIARTGDGTGNDWSMVGFVSTPWSKVDQLMDALTEKDTDGNPRTSWYGPQVLSISDVVEEIPDWQFKGNGQIEAFLFPEGVKRIGKGAFYNCWNMTQTYLPQSLEVIDDYAFCGCRCFALPCNWTDGACLDSTVVIPQSVKYIGHHAFHPFEEIDEKSELYGQCDSETYSKNFMFEGLPPKCDPQAFTNSIMYEGTYSPASTAGYYLPMYEKEWLAVLDGKGEYGGLPMHRADVGTSTQYLEVNGVRWPYYVEDGKAVIGFFSGVSKPTYSTFYGWGSVIKKFGGDLIIPSVIAGYSVKRIDKNTIRWEAPINSVTIPASVREIEQGVTMLFPWNGKPSRIRFCGLPPAGLEESNLITDANLYEYPMSKEAAWLAFFEENGITVNAIPYDDSGETDVQEYAKELKVTAAAYAGLYDGNPHTISVKVEGEYEMLVIEYATSPRGPYTTTPPTFTSVCEGQAVHYRVSAKDCRSVYGYEMVTIYQDLGLVTVKTPVPVPVEWLKTVYKLGDNANFEAAAQRYTGKVDPVLGPLQAWQEYVMGTDPSDPDSRFLVGLETKEEGGFRITWSPDKSNEHHIYTVLGKQSLSDPEWTVIPDPENPPEGFCFFGAKVDLDDYMMGLLKAQRPAVHFAGDIDGDGEVTEKDLTKLKNYLAYQNQIKNGLASEHLSKDWSLTADELDAADVNGDGVVDRDDEKALKNLIKGK